MRPPTQLLDRAFKKANQGRDTLLDSEKAGLAKADKVLERTYKTEATHQGYIEPHACLAQVGNDGQADLWCCTQGQYMVRDTCAAIMGLSQSRLKVTASEIGGGFGGKTTVFIEPVALALAKKSGRPVKMVMSRSEVLRATGPTASSSIDIRMGMTKDGKITAGFAELRYQGGAYPGSPVEMGSMSAFAPYDLENVKTVGWDVVANRPKQAAYRAPGAPMAAFAVESAIDELGKSLGLDPLEVRLKNAAREGTKASYGVTYPAIGLEATLRTAKDHPHWTAPLGENQGRGVACGFWFNFGGNTCVSLNVTPDGTVCLWLGANVMVEYPYDEAIDILELSLKNAKTRADICAEDLDMLRDQIITVEVNMARVFNFDVKERKKKDGAAPKAIEA